jgi:DNA-binding CsgD family transcriptional regulator
LVGRDSELAALGLACSAAESGEGGLFLLAGEAGVGKTRLGEAAISAGSLTPLRGPADQRGSAPYAPIAGVLREHLRNEPDGLEAVGELRAHLAPLLPEIGRPSDTTDRETLFEAIRAALEAVCRDAPTVAFLDDLQWADAATLELLPSLAAAAEEWPLLILGAYRNEEIPRGHALRMLRADLRRSGRLNELVVEPLDPAATSALAAQALGEEPGPMLAAALHDRTQGVPFFVEELAAALLAGSKLILGRRGLELADGATVPIPETIRDAVRLRTEPLSAETRSTLEGAAVAGTRFELQLLSELGEDRGLAEALEQGLLVEREPGVAAFRHDLAREAVYADTPWTRRRALHRALAELLQPRSSEPRLLADHWLAAGDAERARPLLLDAAKRYCGLHAYRDGASALRKALELWPEEEDEPGRLEALEQLGRCAELSGELSEAARSLEEVAKALEDEGDLQRMAELKRRLATIYQLQGANERATAARIEAAETFASCGLAGEAAADHLVVADLLVGPSPEGALGHVRKALDAARGAGRADLEARALAYEGFLLGQMGPPEEASEAARAAISIALAANDVDAAVEAYWVLGMIGNSWADFAAAEAALEAAIELCETHDRPADEYFCMSCLALVLWAKGEWERAEALAKDLLERPVANAPARAHGFCALGLIDLARGASRRAGSNFRKALALGQEVPLPGTIMQSRVGLALLDELAGVDAPQWQEILESVPDRIMVSYPQGLRWASTFAAERGDKARVQACADTLSAYAAKFGSPEALAALAHALGEGGLLEGNPEGATRHFAQALELLEEVESPFDRAHVQVRSGVALAAAGEREAGVERIADGYRSFRKLGARPFWLLAAAQLEALGEPVDRRLGRRAAGDLERGGLTRRELEILRLVAVGRANREIARELFLSPRTVEMHVSNVLTKLDCRSRTQATARAYELNLLERAAAG